jgi:hypothetical protein
MQDRNPLFLLGLAFALLGVACSPPDSPEKILFADPLDSLDSVITKSSVFVDPEISRDGRGSIRVEATGPTTVRIAEISPENLENAILIYRASLRTENLSGQAYLEMWCSIRGKGEFFSRALHAPLSGTTDWVSQETPFFLDPGQHARTVRLNLVVSGQGRVWIDDIVLARASR